MGSSTFLGCSCHTLLCPSFLWADGLAGLLLQGPPGIPDLEDLCQHPFFPSSIPAAVFSSAVEPFFGQIHLQKHPSSPGCHHSNSSKGKQSCTGYLPISLQILNAVGWVFFRIDLLLQSQRPEVEDMIREMGMGQSAVEQLAVYCVSLKKYVLWPLCPSPRAKPWHPSHASPSTALLLQGRASEVKGQALEPCWLSLNPDPTSHCVAGASFLASLTSTS